MSSYGPTPSPYDDFSYFHRCDDQRPWERPDANQLLNCSAGPADMDLLKNQRGCIRWRYIRGAYFSKFIGLDTVVSAMKEWRDTPEYLWLDALDSSDKVLGSVFVRAAKRGNDVYKNRLSNKFGFFEYLPPIHFFCEEWGHKTTPMLFLTLTIDPSQVNNDIDEAWRTISWELHSFETKLRQAYGSFVHLRVWEAHASGYPHCHVVVYFPHRTFEVWEHLTSPDPPDEPKRTWRVSNASRDKIESFWTLGHVDIQGVADTHGALSEVRKYITKSIWTEKGDLTLACCSLFNKQSYSLSQCNYAKKRAAALKRFVTVEATAQYLADNVGRWASKDFIGAIWGVDAYIELYRRWDEGLAEPGLSHLVKQAMQDCNNALPAVDHFAFRGSFLASDLRVMMPDFGDGYRVVTVPPPEARLFFGVDRLTLSLGCGSRSSRFGDGDDE